MKKTEKAAIARIITDLIKADGIIDLREMNTLDDLQNKYDITDNDWKSGGSIHLAESLDVLKELDAETRQELLNDFCHVPCLTISVPKRRHCCYCACSSF